MSFQVNRDYVGAIVISKSTGKKVTCRLLLYPRYYRNQSLELDIMTLAL